MRSRPLENPELIDYRATILLLVAATGLSVKSLLGFDLELLVMDYRAWPAEPWRLFTSCLLHGSWLHLVFNLVWTLRFGAILEPIFGTAWMIGVFLLLGTTSAAMDWTFSGPSVGLSGIGYGLFGVLFALDRFDKRYRGVMTKETAELFGLWFVFCIVATYMEWMPIANIAHGAGFVLGFVIGWSVSKDARRRFIGFSSLTALVIVSALGAFVLRPYVNRSEAHAWELAREGYLALERDDDEAALDFLLQSVDIAPAWAHPWHNLGVALNRLERVDEADHAFRREDELLADEASKPDRSRSFYDLMSEDLRE